MLESPFLRILYFPSTLKHELDVHAGKFALIKIENMNKKSQSCDLMNYVAKGRNISTEHLLNKQLFDIGITRQN